MKNDWLMHTFVLSITGLCVAGCAAAAPTATPAPGPMPVPTAQSTLSSLPSPTATQGRAVGSCADWLVSVDYDADVPLEVKQVGAAEQGQASVRDITFAGSAAGERVAAYLVIPLERGKHPAILYVHWLGEQKSNRQEFLDEAVKLADSGVASLLVDDLLADLHEKWSGTNAQQDRQLIIRQVVQLRRAVDLLTAQADVDPDRIAFVGHDFGAMFGALLAGVDHRFKTLVLIAPAPDYADWFLLGTALSPDRQKAYRDGLDSLAPIRCIGRVTSASLFVQFGRNDDYVSQQQAEAFYLAANEPKRIAWYPWGHALQLNDAASQDRIEWLGAELGLEK